MTSTLHQMWALNNKHSPKKSFQNEAQKGILQIAVLIILQPGPLFYQPLLQAFRYKGTPQSGEGVRAGSFATLIRKDVRHPNKLSAHPQSKDC